MRDILIVDDSPLIIAQLRDILILLGYTTVGSAASGAEAIESARVLRPDAILMDIVMPGELNGIDAARLIHEELDIPIIFLTGSQDNDIIEKIKDSGAYGYIEKPVNESEIGAAIEIALQKKRSVRKLRDLYEDLVENTNDFVYVLDNRGTIKFLNRNACQSIGESSERLIGRNIKDFILPESYERAVLMFSKRLKGEQVGTFEIEIYDAKGNIRTIETRERPVWENGRIIEIHGIGRDITERKQADEIFRKREERYRIVTDNMRDTVWVLDKNLKLVFVSPSVERARGYTFEEIKAIPLEKNMTPESFNVVVTKIVNMLNRAKTGADSATLTEVMNIEWLRKGGATYWTEVSLTLITDETGDPVEILGVGRDITERTRAETALKESEQRYRLLAENANDVIFTSDLNMTTTYISPSVARLRGFSAEEAITQTIADVLMPVSLTLAMNTLREELEIEATGKGDPSRMRRLELEETCKDGSTIWTETTLSFLRDGRGTPTGILGITRDITDRKKAEEAIRDSERRYRLLAENANDAIFTADMNMMPTYISPSMARLRGFPIGEMMSQHLSEVLTPASFQLASGTLRNELETETSDNSDPNRMIRLELETPRKDGSTVWIEATVSFLRDERGNPSGILGIARDITERRNAENAVRESERRYRLLAENVNDAIFAIDMDFRFTYVSPSITRLRGVTVQEVMLQTPADVLTPDSLEAVMDAFREEIEIEALDQKDLTRARTLRLEHICKDGSTVWTETKFSAMRDKQGAITGIIGVARDISERMKAEEALRQSEEKFRSVFETSRDLLYIATIDGKMLEFSKSAKDFLGYTDEELMQMNLQDHYVNPNERERFVRKVLEEGYVEHYELKLMKKDGTLVDTLITVVARRDANGTIIGLQGAVKDMTRIKRLEQQLVQSEKLSGLGTMISGVAHELNNPLTVIMGNTELMLLDKSLPSKDIKSLKVIFKESERAARIVSGLLTFAREHRPEHRMININDIVKESYKLREYNLITNNIEVTLALSADISPILADPYQLQQVFTNIIHNARDALMEIGGGTLAIRTFSINNRIGIEFVDNGPGIDKDNLKRIFDPFFTTKDVGKGTGLGLSMAYGIVNEHGGTIEVESEVGRGTKFLVELPVTTGTNTNTRKTSAPRSAAPSVKTILIVDDEKYIRDLLKQALSEKGHTVRTASTVDDAILLSERKQFDAIVLDIKMPGMGGKELYAHIKNKSPELADRMLFITGDVLGDDSQVFLKTTAARYLEKPFKIDVFINALNEVLEI